MKLTSITDGWTHSGVLLNALATFSDGKLYRFQWTEEEGILKMASPDKPSKNPKHQTWDWGRIHSGRIFPARARLIMAAPDQIRNVLQCSDRERVRREGQEKIKLDEEARIRGNAQKITEAGPEAHRIIMALFKRLDSPAFQQSLGRKLCVDVRAYEKATRPE